MTSGGPVAAAGVAAASSAQAAARRRVRTRRRTACRAARRQPAGRWRRVTRSRWLSVGVMGLPHTGGVAGGRDTGPRVDGAAPRYPRGQVCGAGVVASSHRRTSGEGKSSGTMDLLWVCRACTAPQGHRAPPSWSSSRRASRRVVQGHASWSGSGRCSRDGVPGTLTAGAGRQPPRGPTGPPDVHGRAEDPPPCRKEVPWQS